VSDYHRNIHVLVASLLAVGFAWIGYQMMRAYPGDTNHTFCLIKKMTGFPCPSCGVTRSIILLLQGEMCASLMMNPLGVAVWLMMVMMAVWLLSDLILGKRTFNTYFSKIEKRLNNKYFLIPFFTLIMLNWAWNIYKYL